MIKIYTDGACSGNPGRGGWAAIIIDGEKVEKISGASENTTNNRMELIAVISALKYVQNENIELFTDSKYTKDGIEKWIYNWKKNGWKTANKQSVKNIDLWQDLDQLNLVKLLYKFLHLFFLKDLHFLCHMVLIKIQFLIFYKV